MKLKRLPLYARAGDTETPTHPSYSGNFFTA